MAGIGELAKVSGVKKDQIADVIDGIIALCKDGQDVRISGLGTFSKRHVEAREGHNPATMEKIKIPAKDKLHFKVAKDVDMNPPKAAARRR